MSDTLVRRQAFALILVSCLVGSAAASPPRSNEAIYLRGHIDLIPQLTLGGGSEEGESAPVFFRPRDVDVGKDGHIYVLDGETCEVVVFDANGTYLTRFAREGEGPGELRDPIGLKIDHLGNIVIYETGNRRFSWFDAGGHFVTARRYHTPVARFACSRTGFIFVQTEVEHYENSAMSTQWTLAVLDSTLHSVVVVDSLRSQRWMASGSGTNTTISTQPYYEELLWCVGPSGELFVARSMSYEIKALTPTFDARRKIRRNVPPPLLTALDRNKYLKQLPSSWSSKQLHSQIKWPGHMPYFQALLCDSNGYLLAHRGNNANTSLLDVYRPNGTFLGEVHMQAVRYTSLFDGDSVFMRVFSDRELPSVVQYRME